MDGTATPQARAWEIDGLRYEGLSWGPKDGVPVLALHGWMDHAGSFQVLAPKLAGCHVVAPDLSGQGLSGRRALHATYNIWDDLPQLAGLVEQLGWESCVVMGHSRGANIASLFTAARPGKVRALVALDSLVPEPNDPAAFVTTLQAFVDETRAKASGTLRTFASVEEYVARRQRQGNSPETSAALAERALEEVPEGVRMRGDPRLFASSAVRLTRDHVEALLRSLTCPVLNIWAEGGVRQKRPQIDTLIARARDLVPEYETLDLPGDHHVHMDAAGSERIAAAVTGFLGRHGMI
ncbi:alpha/beta fold hydrolase [Pseudooceanicola sp.]|jgi:pimeloyl-ACP methyl ester carboxylesterase|uniref:alpha/beta fold hydrolase n=1 Tax=Pseudooceanicola sp. TaxID=1914328 RepID=UPI004059D9B8